MRRLISIHDVESTLRHFEALRATMRRRVAIKGGVTAVSKRYGINQPSLSRILNSNKYVPKRYATILKYAQALQIETFLIKLSETEAQEYQRSREEKIKAALQVHQNPFTSKAEKLEAIIRQMVRHENLNKEDMPLVCEVLMRELQTVDQQLKRIGVSK